MKKVAIYRVLVFGNIHDFRYDVYEKKGSGCGEQLAFWLETFEAALEFVEKNGYELVEVDGIPLNP